MGVFNRNRSSGDIARAMGLLLRYGLARCKPAGEGRAELWFATIPSGTPTNSTNSTN